MQTLPPTLRVTPPKLEPVLPYWLALLLGLFTLLFGILVLITPSGYPTVVTHLLGLYWLSTGMLLITNMFLERTHVPWKALGGILGAAAGLLILNHPAWTPALGTNVQAMLIAVAGVGLGIACLVIGLRRPDWGLGAAGILNIVLGVLVLLASSLAGAGGPILLGVIIISGGIIIIIRSFI